ncbi:hypothetical protein [Pantoea ananatis]|uniref:hypothetical protein n=1 Tax=Pantoea ananas TaxID=553 RepID=UPI0024481B25|nr:hypothetical protein [Pantoea ananatis]MDH0053813.1 hypothetical protein [Pantoea ananatis]
MKEKFDYYYLFSKGGELKTSIDIYDYGVISKPEYHTDAVMLHALNSGLTNIAEAISSSGSNSLSDGIWLALIGALSAFLFNIVQKRYEKSSVKLSKSGEATLSLIKELEAISVEYWLKGYDDKDIEKSQLSEINIKAMLMTLDANIKTIIDNLPMVNKTENKTYLRDFSSGIYDLASGGDFESTSRRANRRTASKIARKCSDAKAMLLKLV